MATARYRRKLHMKAYPSTEAPLQDRVSYNGYEAEWTPSDIENLRQELKQGKHRPLYLRYEHQENASKLGEVTGVYYNEVDKWMHAKCIFDCPQRAKEVQDGRLRGVSLSFARVLGTTHKRPVEISLTDDPDFERAKVTVIRSHSDNQPDEYQVPLSAGPKVINKLMATLDNTTPPAEETATLMTDDTPASTPTPTQETTPGDVVQDAVEGALAQQMAPVEQAQPEPFTAEKLRAMEEQVSLEERAEMMNRLVQEKNALEQEKRAREEQAAKEAEEARQAEIAQKREALRPTMERIMSIASSNMPEEQKRAMVDEFVPMLERSEMLQALINRTFSDQDTLSKQVNDLQAQAKQAQEEREKSEQMARALQDQLAETRHLIETLDASRQAGLNLSAREIIKTHSKRNPNMSQSIYDQWFGTSATSSSTTSSSSSSSGETMATLASRQEQAERDMPTNKLIEASKSLFSSNKGEVIMSHSRGSKRGAEQLEEPQLVGFLRHKGVLGGAQAEQKRQRRLQKYGEEQSGDLTEVVMRHSKRRQNYIETRREQRQNSDALPPMDESRAVVYNNLGDAIKEVQEFSVKGDSMVTNSLLGTDTNGFIQLLDECYVQRRNNIPDNGNPGTRGTLDLPVLGVQQLDALPQHERSKYPSAFFNPAWRAENARRREEFNRTQGFKVF